jgi:hypothetical protein
MSSNQSEFCTDLLIEFWKGSLADASKQIICRQLARLVVEKLPRQVADECRSDLQSQREVIRRTLDDLVTTDPAARELMRALTGNQSTPTSHPNITQSVNVTGQPSQIFTAGGDMIFSSGIPGLPSTSGAQSPPPSEAVKPKTRILLVEANPVDTTRLRLTAELRTIQECIQRSKRREALTVTPLHATRIQDLQRALLEEDYQIIHLSGHGEGEIIFEKDEGASDPIPQEALAKLLANFHPIECVVLNACYSSSQAQLIARYIPYTIAMDSSITDDAAHAFSRGFYDTIGAGKDYRFAYEMGCQAIELTGHKQFSIPKLFEKRQITE